LAFSARLPPLRCTRPVPSAEMLRGTQLSVNLVIYQGAPLPSVSLERMTNGYLTLDQNQAAAAVRRFDRWMSAKWVLRMATAANWKAGEVRSGSIASIRRCRHLVLTLQQRSFCAMQ
jgi:hypothetical protein